MMDTTSQGDFILGPGEKHVQCPYNTSHIVTDFALPKHMTKCRREYEKECERRGKRKEMRTCNYNSNHRVLAPEIEWHQERCDDRFNLLETIRYHASDEFTRKMEEDERRRKERDYERHNKDKHGQQKHDHKDPAGINYNAKPTHDKPEDENIWGETEEDWESEAKGYEAAYNPQEKLQNEVIMYQPRGLSKSERKKFRAEQKLKAAIRDTTDRDSEIKGFDKLTLEDKPNANFATDEEEQRDWNEVEVEDKNEPRSSKGHKSSPQKMEPALKGLEKDDDYEPFIGEDPFS